MAEFQITTDLAVIRDITVAANFDELLAAVAEIAAPYEAMVVTPDTVRNAAADRAKLRKLQSRIDEQRKAVKAACMAPAEAFAEKMKPALDKIGAAIDNLDRQVKAYEAQEAENKFARLKDYFEQSIREESRDYADWEKISARHKDWRNKGKGEDQCRNEIQMELANIDRSLDALRGYPEQYKVPMLEAFARNYDLADSLAVFQNMKRREETERVLAEKKRLEAEERLKNEAAGNRQQATGDESTDCHVSVPEPRKDGAETAAESAESDQNVRYVEFWVEVTPEQSKALGRFLKENGIKYGAIRR
jgi:hypothetical protein